MVGPASGIFGASQRKTDPRERPYGVWRPWTPRASFFPAPSSTGATDPTASHGSGRRRRSPICPERAVANAGARAWSREIMPGECGSIACSHRSNARLLNPGAAREPRRPGSPSAPVGQHRARNERWTYFLAGLAPLWTVFGTDDRHPTMQSHLRLLHRI